MRIVALLASGTEIVYGLGLGEQLVGISHECDYPPAALTKPRVSRSRFDPAAMSSVEIDCAVRDAMEQHGAVYELDEQCLRELEPDLLLSQAVCDVCAVPTSLAEKASQALGGGAQVLSLDAHDVGGILACIQQVAGAAGVEDRGARLVASLEARMAAVAMFSADLQRPRVLAVEWLAPPFVPGHWTPEMIHLAGGEPIVGEVGRPSTQVSWDELSGLDPDILVVMPCGYDLDQARADADRHAERLVSIAERAVDAGRAYVVNGSAYFNRSGPRIVDGIEILGALFHPARFPDAELEGCAAPWVAAPRRPSMRGDS